jgi:hypothetical protein
VWRRAQVAAYLSSRAGGAPYDPAATPRGHNGRWTGPGEAPGPVPELRDWLASGRAREIRLAAGLTLADMAGQLGAGLSGVSRWERGLAAPADASMEAAYHDLLARLAAGPPGLGR